MNLTELKGLFHEHDFRPSKRAGQNFLADNNVRDKIINAVSVGKDDVILEIGAGFGVMSFGLAARCSVLYAVEKDESISRVMAPRFAASGNITLIKDDILNVDIPRLAEATSGKIVVFGNIPYCITTPIVEKIIDNRNCVREAYLLAQEELVARLASPPGSKEYGSLSCYAQFHARIKRLFKVSRSSFYPRPAVDSCFFRMELLERPSVDVKDEKLFFEIVRKAFSQRRKKAVKVLALSGIFSARQEDWIKIFEKCGISALSRAEEISLEQFGKIADKVNNG